MRKMDYCEQQDAYQGENNNSQKFRQYSHNGGIEAQPALHVWRRIETLPHAGAESPAKPLHRQRQADDHHQGENHLQQRCQALPIGHFLNDLRHVGEKLRQIMSQFRDPLLK